MNPESWVKRGPIEQVSTNFQNSPKIPLTRPFAHANIHLVAKTRTPPSEWQRTSEMNRQPKIKGLIFIPSAPSQLNRDDYKHTNDNPVSVGTDECRKAWFYH